MARVLLVALTWVASASASRYVDYSGVKMPQYGTDEYEGTRDASRVAAVEDYHGHAPDASSSLDYKYEEETRGKSEKLVKEVADAESWRKPSRKQRELMRPPEVDKLETMDKYDLEAEMVAKYKPSFPQHRSRLKGRYSRKEGEPSRRQSVKYDHGTNYISDIGSKDYFNVDKYEFRGDKSKKFEGDIDHFKHRDVTERVIRRKPRDRFMRSRTDTDFDMEEEELEPNRRMQSERRMEQEYLTDDESQHARQDGARGPRFRPVDELASTNWPLAKPRQKAYEDYGDYYDMKRVHNIKNKLPMLLRRSSAMTAVPTAKNSNVVDALWPLRRTIPPPATRDSDGSVDTPTASTSFSTTTTTISTNASHEAGNYSRDLSFAEKSRLSILKKAQRKESLKINSSTKKPPVLLQVTNKIPVVVMVEPASNKPWMRAREVSHDTPERIERAKLLMRHKLLARARNIQDLTDNWDEVICDYIDVSLLDTAPEINHSIMLIFAAIILVVAIQ